MDGREGAAGYSRPYAALKGFFEAKVKEKLTVVWDVLMWLRIFRNENKIKRIFL
ncbi:hypothetical protein GCM10023261_09140 [Bartonella jaculi]|uniref:Uncharacterized protein n=1 Tax=Bartonella jaculi TaxID=686226 RepID=A0ABP9N4A6_9HYPH